jgi:hypothetical protein
MCISANRYCTTILDTSPSALEYSPATNKVQRKYCTYSRRKLTYEIRHDVLWCETPHDVSFQNVKS